MENKEIFQIGDVVSLKSGGPLMTVQWLLPIDNLTKVVTIFWIGGKIEMADFDSRVLARRDAEKKPAESAPIADGHITPQQAWEHAPDGATHLVMNENASWYWMIGCILDPASTQSGFWRIATSESPRATWESYIGPPIHFTGDWTDSLHKKPQSQQ